MTPTESKIYYLYNYLLKLNGIPATYQEIADILSVSKITIWEHVQNLINKGYLIKVTPLNARQVL
jgi:biotin operon repressor